MTDPGTVVIVVTIVVCVYSYAMAKLAVTRKAAFLERKETEEAAASGLDTSAPLYPQAPSSHRISG